MLTQADIVGDAAPPLGTRVGEGELLRFRWGLCFEEVAQLRHIQDRHCPQALQRLIARTLAVASPRRDDRDPLLQRLGGTRPGAAIVLVGGDDGRHRRHRQEER